LDCKNWYDKIAIWALQYIPGSKGKGAVPCNGPAPCPVTGRSCKPGPIHLFVSSAMATADGSQRDVQLTSTDVEQIVTRIFFLATVGSVDFAEIPAISHRSFGIISLASTSPSLYILFAKFVTSY